MKIAQKINMFCLVITLVLYITIFLGLYAQIALGAIQILIALYISCNLKTLSQKLKHQIINYWIYVALYSVLAIVFFNDWIGFSDNTFILILIVILLPMSIATYFTITLNKIAKQNETK